MSNRRRFVVRGGQVVEVTGEERGAGERIEIRVVDDAHVSHALPRRRDMARYGLSWHKYDGPGPFAKPRFDTNNDVREFQRRNPMGFARE